MEVHFPPDQQKAIETLAAQCGEAPDAFVRRTVEDAIRQQERFARRRPLKSAYGLLAQYGPGPSKEDIDANRREMFRHFGERSL